jgi:uncharacterized repeat protein (TIGR01451 family)
MDSIIHWIYYTIKEFFNIMLNSRKQTKVKAVEVTNVATLEVNGTPLASDKVTILVAESADLSVTTIKPMHHGYVGQNVIYVIKVTNKGLSKATGVVLTNILPPNSICSYINFTQGTYKRSRNRITFYLGELLCNSNAIVIISIIPKCPCILTNHCFVTANEHDKNWDNNLCTTNTKVHCVYNAPIYFISPQIHYL